MFCIFVCPANLHVVHFSYPAIFLMVGIISLRIAMRMSTRTTSEMPLGNPQKLSHLYSTETDHFWSARSGGVSIGQASEYTSPISADETTPVVAFHSLTDRLGRPTVVNRCPARRHQIHANGAHPNKLGG